MDTFFESGRFKVGVNYWASHAGTNMWTDWRPESVAKDLAALAKAGVEVIRVFPLWPAFQPLDVMRGGHGHRTELRFGEEPLPDTEAGRAGVSEEAMARFEAFARMAGENRIGLVVGLLTGWMSGRLFMPKAFDGLNPLTDPFVIMWERRFVKHFVRRFKGSKAVVGWDLGNECNCMGPVNREQAYAWSAAITDAIRVEDPSRPVVSGMHSLAAGGREAWRIQDQAELTDILTTHPYPPFTPHCGLDPIDTMRSCLHATAESRMYGDVGGKPCMAEEIGTLGNMFADEETAARYVRTNMFSLWAHDCRAFVWWCAFDQDHLKHAPYDWCNVERELGLLRKNREPKPVAGELGRFKSFLKRMPFDRLPIRVVDAVCLLSPQQDNWAAAYASFVLARQAGIDIEFQYTDQPFRDAKVYLLPSVMGFNNLSRRRWEELKSKVGKGATLYISMGDAMISGLKELIGLRVVTREHRSGGLNMSLDGTTLPAWPEHRIRFAPAGAEVLAAEEDGNPAFSRFKLGRGEVFFLSWPLETELADRLGVFHKDDAPPYRRIYEKVFAGRRLDRVVRKDHPLLGVTEHPLGKGRRVVVAINYSPEPLKANLELARGWKAGKVLYGAALSGRGPKVAVSVAPNDAVVLTAIR